MKKVGIVACSDAQRADQKQENLELVNFLRESGREVRLSRCIYEREGIFAGTGKERAFELMEMFNDPNIEEIYDISGGDMANEVLDHLNFDEIAKSRAVFWGYSDLSTVINAVYSQTGKQSVLYQIKNTVWSKKYNEVQRRRFLTRENLFDPAFRFIQGKEIKGTVVGGNIRCFLKLAGTKYFPDVENKVLLIESMSGKVPRMAAHLAQLKSMGVFNKIKGIIMGTFCQMQDENLQPDIVSLVKSAAGKDMPIAKTEEIGHYFDSKAIVIGKEIHLKA